MSRNSLSFACTAIALIAALAFSAADAAAGSRYPQTCPPYCSYNPGGIGWWPLGYQRGSGFIPERGGVQHSKRPLRLRR